MDDERLIVRYLLGELLEAEQIRLEERFFTDEEYFERLQAVEDDLIDDYVRGELSRRERERFEIYFLASPGRRERVEFARALMKTLSEAPVMAAPASVAARPETISWWQSLLAFLRPQGPAFRFAVAAVMLVVVVGSAWLIVETMQLRTQLARLRAERQALQRQEQELQQQVAQQRAHGEQVAEQLHREQQEREQLEQEIAELQPSQPPIVSFELSPHLTRESGERAKLAIPRGARSVRIRLSLEEGDEYPSYRAVLSDAEEKEIWRWDRLQPTNRGTAVVVRLPARLLTAGDYTLTLMGVTAGGEEIVNYYDFGVMKR
ncbi:MAG: hypothetical protein HY314_08615 [Acidobacteria bacterium]|nr:hypothetical protein [Acidobacteriota bacterium]